MYFIILSLTFSLSNAYQCMSKQNLDPTIDVCRTILPYTYLAKLDNIESSSADITIENMKNEYIWDNIFQSVQNELRCIIFHPPCDINNNTLPICVDSCTKYVDNYNTFENSAKTFCQKYFNPTNSQNCIRINISSLLFTNMLLIFMPFIVYVSL